MFGKVVKHELLANIKLYGVMLGLGVIIVVFTVFGMIPLEKTGFYPNIMGISVGLAIFCSIMLLLVLLLHFIWQGMRYSKSMYGNEGYLSFTLPVSPVELVLGKFVAYMILNICVAILCGFLFFSISYNMMKIADIYRNHVYSIEYWHLFWKDMRDIFSEPKTLYFAINFLLSMVLHMMVFTNYIFLAVTLANLSCFQKGNTILTFVFLYFIPYLEELVMSFIFTIVLLIKGETFLALFERLNMAMEIGDFPVIFDYYSYMLWGGNIMELVFLVINMGFVIWLVKKHTAVTA